MSDLIRREDVENTIQRLCDLCGEYERHNGVMCGACNLDNFIRVLDDIPSAEPEPKKGHWTGDCCSCCGVSKYNYIKMVDDECGPFGTWNFCPHCGADMRGENEQ